MKKFLSLLCLSALVISSCEKDDTSGTAPELNPQSTELNIPAEGGSVDIIYEVLNPSENGDILAVPSADWMHDFTYVDETLIRFTADTNESDAVREGTVTLTYTYDGNKLEAVINLTQEPVTETAVPEIDLEASLDIPAAGGSVTFTYNIINPVEDGRMTAESNADWATITDVTDTYISLDIAANSESAERTTVVTLTYTYNGGETCEVGFTIIQEAAENPEPSEYKYETTALVFSGMYYGASGNNGEYNYYTDLSDLGYENSSLRPGASYYTLDLWAAAAPSDPSNPLPPAGTYTIGEGYSTNDMTFSSGYSYGFGVDDDLNYIFNAKFAGGTIVIEYEGENMILDAILTDTEGDKHHVTFNGPAKYYDYSY